jgi:hypothetical protein
MSLEQDAESSFTYSLLIIAFGSDMISHVNLPSALTMMILGLWQTNAGNTCSYMVEVSIDFVGRSFDS